MTTVSVPQHDGQAAAASRSPVSGFAHLLQSEWTKIRSVRSTFWTLIVLVVVTVGFTALLTLLISTSWDKAQPAQRASTVADPVATIMGTGLSFGQLAICVLGVLVISAEYSTGVIRASLLAVPRRLPMLTAKVLVFAVLVFVVGEIAAFGSFFVGSAILHSHAPVSLSDTGVIRAVLGAGLYLAVLGIFSLSIGTLLRHTAAGISTVIGIVFVLPIIGAFLPGDWGKHVRDYLPSAAGEMITRAQQGPDQVLSPWQGFGVFCIWTAVLLVLAAYFLRRRDA
jgi:ABC-2 type transport system permease protein